MIEAKEEKWINIGEAAEYFGVKAATVRDWIKKNDDFPTKKIGKSWKFRYSELEAWVEKQSNE